MFALLFFFLLVGSGAVSSKRCTSPAAPRHGSVSCHRDKRSVSCTPSLPEGSIAEFSCREFYQLTGSDSSLKCESNGSWSAPAPKCIPDCGRARGEVSLIANADAAARGVFPWHVAIYHLSEGEHEYWCGGSLTSEVSVITAAHCVWEIPPEELVLVSGKFHRQYEHHDENTQTRKVKKVEMLRTYQDVEGNYNGDIAVVFLREPIVVDRFSAPVCVDWEQRLDGQLTEGDLGLALGWGLTEDDTFSDALRAVRLPVVSDERCIAEQEQDFRKFITYTTFCAGFGNGTGVCNGDSGGGLTFLDEASGRWYLQGLVSVSPRRKGTPYCDLNFYTVFTKVAAFTKWLKRVLGESPAEWNARNSQNASRTQQDRKKKKEIVFIHTEKMLELARLAQHRKRQKEMTSLRHPQASSVGLSLSPRTMQTD